MKLDWLTEDARTFLKRGYLRDGQTAEDRYQEICDTIYSRTGSLDLYNRFIRYIESNWVSLSSPVIANFGKKQNLPISCNKSKIFDSLDSILNGAREVGMLSKYGAGTSVNFSELRSAGSAISSGGISEGIMPFIEIYNHLISKVSQNSTRRGMMAAYLSVEHDEILDFLDIGSDGSEIQLITTGVTIPEGWMESLKDGDLEKRKIWAKILKSRNDVGYPYILWEDNCNGESKPQVYKDKNVWLNHSNLCSEIIEYCDEKKTFACCLSSVNLYHFDDWKDDPDFIFDMNLFLDLVMGEYIEKSSKLPGLGRARRFAEEHRAIGLGVLGFHSYLQKKMIPISSMDAVYKNDEIFKHIRQESDRASKWMAENWGEPEYMKGTGLRNSSRIAIAPTKSSSFIMGGYSLGIEPLKSNFHAKTLAKVQVEFKNPELGRLLEQKSMNTQQVWRSILKNNGSVQHLDFLSELEKDVFKTFSEVSQLDLIKLAAFRQKHIDQGQSLNLTIHPDTPPKEINKLMLTAYEMGIKTLYYQYGINMAQEYNKELMQCSNCEG